MNNGLDKNPFSVGVAGVSVGGHDGTPNAPNAAHGAENAELTPIIADADFRPEPVWMPIARREIGQKEIRGEEDNPRIILYHQTTSLKAKEDEVPWCSSFVNWVFQKAQMERTNSAAARSWKEWGEELEKPIHGAVVVLHREGGNHVGFFMRLDNSGRFVLLGGNQSNAVNEAAFDPKLVQAIRWPKGLPQKDFNPR